jgi:hypothetical protein
MPVKMRGQRTKGARRSTRPRAAAEGSDSRHGSGSLTDTFVAEEERHPRTGTNRRVEAPQAIEQMEVRRSSRMASLARPMQATTSNMTLVEAPPGGKRAAGYVYQVLPPVVEETAGSSGHVGGPTGSSGNADGFWDISTPQVNPEACNDVPAGQKCSATSAAPGTPRRGCNPMHRASATDFSPTHFVEPQSDVPIPQEGAWDAHHDLASPMRTTPAHSRTQMLTPISLNPLLQTRRNNSTVTHAPSPTSSQSCGYRTSNVNVAWAAADGLIPIPEGFAAPGYVPAIVGGISFEVRTPSSQRRSTQGSSIGRRLFSEYTQTEQSEEHGPHAAAAARIQFGQQTALQARTHVNTTGLQTATQVHARVDATGQQTASRMRTHVSHCDYIMFYTY